MSDDPRLPTPAAGSVRALLQLESVKARFAEVLKDKAPQFIASLASLVYASKALKECEPYSVIAAALKAAALDLPIEPALGFAAIVPYKGVAQFQMQWKGYVQLAHRTGQYAGLNVTETYTGMVKGVNTFTGEVKKGERTGDELTGYYAWFKLLNGFEKEIWMPAKDVLEHGARYSKTFNSNNSAWKTDPDSMGRKTVIKRLLTRWGILSVEMQSAVKAEVIPDDFTAIDAPAIGNGNGDGNHGHEEGPGPDYTDPAFVSGKIDQEELERTRLVMHGEPA